MDYFDEKDIAKLIRSQDKELEAYVVSIIADIERQLGQVTRAVNPNLPLADLLAILNKLNTESLPVATKQKIQKSIELYQSRIDTVRDMIKQVISIDTVFNDNDNALISSIFQNDIAIQLTTIQQTFNEFKQAIFRGVYTGGLPQLPELQESLSNRLSGELYTQTNTQLAAFQRSIHLQKSEELGLRYFLYSGSLIKSSRDFCIQRAGRVYTIEEAQKWDNKQGLPTIPYLGGYNCRHTMVFMTEDKAVSLGYRKNG